jgi:site-specific DNA-methyltransferase (cytosine-N4-specific)
MFKIINNSAIEASKELDNESVDLIVTSPPYFGCRDYGGDSSDIPLGREEHPKDYVNNIVENIHAYHRVLKPTGSLYLNIGDVYFGTKGFSRNTGKYVRKTDHHYQNHKIAKQDGLYLQHKQLLMLPARVCIELQELGWILRNNLVWEKPNPIPSFSKDRRLPVFESIFHFVKSKKYYFNYSLSKELGNHRDVIKCGIESFKEHQATFPAKLVEPLVLTTSKKGDTVLDMFSGSGTVGRVSLENERNYIGVEINPKSVKESIESFSQYND